MSVVLFIIGFLICYYGVVVRMEWLMFKRRHNQRQNEEIKSPIEDSSDEFDFLMEDVDKELQHNPLVEAFAREGSKTSNLNKKTPFTVIKNKKSKSI